MSETDMSRSKGREASERLLNIHWDLSRWMGRDIVETWLDIGSEFQDFLAERMREDVKTQHRMLHCTTPAELHQIQAEFLQKALDDYAAETGRMIDLGRRFFTPPE